MNREWMIARCDAALSWLEVLEECLHHIPQKHHAFVFRSQPEVQELWRIAVRETVTPTVEQIQHIRGIHGRIKKLLKLVPSKVIKDIRERSDDPPQ
jgi:hypothetical protein